MPDHPNHPGFAAPTCPMRLTITAKPTTLGLNGYACSVTGGHCLPGQACDSLREEGARKARLKAEIEAALTVQSPEYG